MHFNTQSKGYNDISPVGFNFLRKKLIINPAQNRAKDIITDEKFICRI